MFSYRSKCLTMIEKIVLFFVYIAARAFITAIGDSPRRGLFFVIVIVVVESLPVPHGGGGSTNRNGFKVSPLLACLRARPYFPSKPHLYWNLLKIVLIFFFITLFFSSPVLLFTIISNKNNNNNNTVYTAGHLDRGGGPVRKRFIQTSRNLLRKQYSQGGIAHTRTLNTMNNYFLCSSFPKTLISTSRTVCRRKRARLRNSCYPA